MQQQNLQRIIWLASFPKSGNTWTRAFLANYLAPKGTKLTINQLNQFSTGDVRQDFWDAAYGQRYEGQPIETGIALRPKVLRLIAGSKPSHHFVKTHSRIDRIDGEDLIPPDVTAAAIYIVRNPFDVAVSYARHLDVSLDEVIERMTSPGGVNVSATQIPEFIGRWDDHVASWREARGLPQHLMRYEDMAADTERSFRGLLDFLRIPTDMGSLRRAIRLSSFKELQKQERTEGFGEKPANMDRFFATGTAGGWRATLSPEQIARLGEAFQETLQRHYPEMMPELNDMTGSAG
ncbi:MAG: sulfotransferase domain-containing protein [Pseudomonadota bacterium]